MGPPQMVGGGRAETRPGEEHRFPPPSDTAGGEGLEHRGWLYFLLVPVALVILGVLYLFLGPGTHAHHGGESGFLMFGANASEAEVMLALLILGGVTVALVFLEAQRKEERRALIIQRNLAIAVIVFCLACSVFLWTSYTGLSGSEEAFYYTTEKMYLLKISGLGIIVLVSTLGVLLFIHWHRFNKDGMGMGIGAPMGVAPPPMRQVQQQRRPQQQQPGYAYAHAEAVAN